MIKKKIAVIFGGCSSEYPVSLQSAFAILSNIDRTRYELVLIGIDREGSWYRYNGDLNGIADDTWHSTDKVCTPIMISPDRKHHGLIEIRKDGIKFTKIDAAFPVLHGKNGEDGTVQGVIELAGIPLIGCGTLCSALCMDKDRAHKLVQAVDVIIPKSIVLTRKYDKELIHEKTTKELHYPLFVKPLKAGSSFGITKVKDENDLFAAIEAAFQYDDEVIMEENIEGFEVGCAVMGNHELTVGEVDEIELSDGFFDFKEKYTLESSKIHMPARIDQQTANRIKHTAAAIYKALGCKGFARVDMFLTPDNKIVFNEVNTIPGFTSHSRYPNMMKGIGLSYKELLTNLIELGMKQ